MTVGELSFAAFALTEIHALTVGTRRQQFYNRQAIEAFLARAAELVGDPCW
jgi:hypothetical protein